VNRAHYFGECIHVKGAERGDLSGPEVGDG
jgi:hypothetical protein